MAVTRVSGHTAHGENAAAGASIATSAAITGIASGSLVVVYVACANSGTVTSVRDDLSANAVAANTFNWAAGSERLEHWYFKNYSGGTRTFTANFSGTPAFRAIVAVEYAGADTLNPVGATINNSGNSAAPTSGNVLPSRDGSIIVGSANGSSPAAASPFSDVFAEATTGSDTEDLAQGTAASVAATWTMAAGIWGAIATVFLPTPVTATTAWFTA